MPGSWPVSSTSYGTFNRFGCSRCGRVVTAKKLGHNRDRFIEEARQVHGDRYDYSRVEYIKGRELVEIVCPEHGSF